MKVTPTYREFVIEQLEGITPVVAKSMFGGVGIYSEGRFFAIIADDRLYFKVDESNRHDFEQEGMRPFIPYENRKVVMSYYEVPIHVLEDRDELGGWVRKAVAVAGKPKPSKKAGRTGA